MTKSWFENKYFVLSGGTSGIGLEITRHLINEGARVITFTLFEDEIINLPEDLKKAIDKKKLFVKQSDVTIDEDRKSIVEFVKELGVEKEIVGLINCAGITNYGPYDGTEIKDIKDVISTNYMGTVLLTRDFLPLLKESSKSGLTYIGFVSSITAVIPFPYFGLYASTKAAVESFLNNLKTELPRNLKILMIRAPFVKTRLFERARNVDGYEMTLLAKKVENTALEPEVIGRAFVNALKKKKQGIIYPNFATRLQVWLMTHRPLKSAILGTAYKQIKTFGKKE